MHTFARDNSAACSFVWIRPLLVGLLAGILSAPLASLPTAAVEVETDGLAHAGDRLPKLFILSFNRWGEISNPAEVDFARREIAADPTIDRIIIFSYGWANDGESSYATYYQLLKDIAGYAPPGRKMPNSVVIAVGWDSAQSGFRKLFNDISPFPALASLLSVVPDLLLFPVSFWSKAATADRIGFGGLRESLNSIFEYAYPGGEGTPDVFLAGHSFGTRIVSQLMQEDFGLFPVNADPFVARDHVRGAMLMQPAISQAGLHLEADYPILVTQSEHDHAVGGLFPIANLLINTTTFTSFEALFRYRFHDVARGVAEPTRRAGAAAVDMVDGEEPTLTGSVVRTGARVVSRSAYLTLRSLAELSSVPVALFAGVITTPGNYLYVQGQGLFRHPGRHIMDTLAQVPLVEIGVDLVGDWVEPEVRWGRRGKGFLNLGGLNESIGRLRTPALYRNVPDRVYSLDDFEAARDAPGCGLPRCSGVLLLDASDFIEVGIFGVSLNERRFDYTLGWVDPLGSHSDYRNATVVEILARFFDGNATRPVVSGREAGEAPD